MYVLCSYTEQTHTLRMCYAIVAALPGALEV